METETINWKRIELTNPIQFKEEGIYFNVKILKKIKDRVMCEIDHRGQKMMRPFDFMPIDVQGSIKKQIGTLA